MIRLGIRTQSLLLALLPAVLIAVALAGYYTFVLISDLEDSLLKRGQAVARQLAPASEYGLFAGNLDILQTLLNSTIQESDVRSAAIYDADAHLLVRSGPLPKPHMEYHYPRDRLVAINSHDGLSVSLINPVFQNQTVIDDFDEFSNHEGSPQVSPNAVIGWISIELSRGSTLQKKTRVLKSSLWIATIILLLSAIAGYFLSRRITQPIISMTRAVENLRREKLDTRVPAVKSTSELDTLASGFNIMAAALKSSRDELNEKVDAATREARETMEAIELQNAELAITRKEALAASKAKSKFLANMSHEIRTPLNGVIGYSKLLAKTELSREQRQQALTIHQSANALLHIVNDILDFSKIEADRLELEYLDFAFREIIEDVFDLMAPTAREKGIELTYYIAPEVPPVIRTDPTRLRQILLNLVTNAVKFTQVGSVAVAVSRELHETPEMTLDFSVTDTGVGLSEDEQNRLFQPFTQADTTTTRRYGGTGLGLAISKKLVEKMHGRINLSSVLGTGTTVSFSIRCEDYRERRALLRESAPLKNRTALLFEAQHTTRRTWRSHLDQWGMQTTAFDNVPELEQGLGSEEPPSIVILGFGSNPEPDGPAMVSRLREHFAGPILVIPNSTDHALLDHLRASGASACLSKPVRNSRLHAEMKQLFGHSGDYPDPECSGATLPAEDTLYGLRILVAEDHEVNRRLVTTLLEARGAEVKTAHDGLQALLLGTHEDFDLILMDVHMPEMDGTTVATKLRTVEDADRHTPIIALTADALAGNRDKFLSAGMDDYLSKPIDEETLYNTIHKWVQGNGPSPGEPPAEGSSSNRAADDGALPVWDREAALKVTGGREELMQELLELMSADIPKRQTQIESALQENEFIRAAEAAHTIAGGAGHCGAMALRHAAKELEAICRNSDAESVGLMKTRLGQAIADFQELVRLRVEANG